MFKIYLNSKSACALQISAGETATQKSAYEHDSLTSRLEITLDRLTCRCNQSIMGNLFTVRIKTDT